eukprot:TRINITY_DN25679_c0_g1_i1.p1 TRINITY_DN25679_c0_g1~~TRINITY_DN25679_c0_g1_i1.p1  ORF type:complete len:237 (+),score=12.89 TRINITY_DN25679_c0_g1_i1:50-760(+)
MWNIVVIVLKINSAGASPPSSSWPAFSSSCDHLLDPGSMGSFSRAQGGHCTGHFFYADTSDQKGERVDFDNSQVHQWLGDVKLNYTGPGYILWAPWTSKQTGARFAVYPQLDNGYCCVCCEDKNGCGLVPSDWIARDSGTYLGIRSHNGHRCDVWDAKGGQSNLYYQDTVSGLPVALDMVTDGNGIHRSFLNASVAPFSSDVFKPPSFCPTSPESTDAYCPGHTCSILRGLNDVFV